MEAVLEPAPIRPDILTRITPERSRELNAIRWAKQAEREAKARIPVDLPPDLPEYQKKRLMRVREQLDRIDDLLLSEDDPAKLDRLAAASMRLAEQERILAGRPLPGSLKPQAARSRRQYREPMPIEPDNPQA